MPQTVAVIDYGSGNLHSVAKALEHAGSCRVLVTSDINEIRFADRVVLPGVGAMGDCMHGLQDRGLDSVVLDVIQEKPLMGVCVGMQILTEFGEESAGVDASLEFGSGDGSTVDASREATSHATGLSGGAGADDVRAAGTVDVSGSFAHALREEAVQSLVTYELVFTLTDEEWDAEIGQDGAPASAPADQANAWNKQTVLCEHELPGTARHDPLAYLQNRTVDWLDHQLAARELLELDVANTPLIVEHEYPPARVQDREALKPILQGSVAFTRHVDEAAAAMYALQNQVLDGQGIPVQGIGRQAYRS